MDFLEHLGDRNIIDRERAVKALQEYVTSHSEVSCLEAHIVSILESPNPSWEELSTAYQSSKVLLDAGKSSAQFRQQVLSACKRDLEHSEVRVRLSIAEVLHSLTAVEGLEVFLPMREILLESIGRNYTRSTEEPEEMEIDPRDIMPSSPRSAALGHFKHTNLMHDTEGWKSLETCMKALQRMCEALGPSLFEEVASHDFVQFLLGTLSHTNRFVRETGFFTVASIVRLASLPFLAEIGVDLSEFIAKGLADNWSQVRFASSVAAREFLEHVENPRDYFHVLIPRLCLNRYYVAEGVRLYNQETWSRVLGNTGREVVAQYIKEVVNYYTLQSEAENHAVREAACQCIAELGIKVDKDAVRPFVKELLDALMVCFRDESWPVRDCACVACGNFVSSFPEECSPLLEELYKLWFDQVSDNIWSVREGSAVALGNVMRTFGRDAIKRVVEYLRENLGRAKLQEDESKRYSNLENSTTFGVASNVKRVRDNDPSLHTDQQAFSCGSLAPRMRKGAKRGCGCMDSVFARDHQHWEFSDGCVYLLRELCAVSKEDAMEFVPVLLSLTKVRHYFHHYYLLETIFKQLPAICENMGVRTFKSNFLNETLDAACDCLESSDNQLALSAAGECVDVLASKIGPRIFSTRLNEHHLAVLARFPQFVNFLEAS